MKLIGMLLKIIAAVIVVFIIAIGVIVTTVDPNDYRDQITTAVKENTGRDFTVSNMNLSVFPELTIDLEAATLSNADGFSSEPFFKVDKVQVGAAIIPLFSKQLEVDTITVHGLQLNLEKDAQGKTNWDDLSKKEAKPEDPKTNEESENPLATLASLNFGGMDIQGGLIKWNDQQSQQTIELKDVDIKTGAITFGEFFNISLAANASVNNPDIQSELTISLNAKLEQSGQYAVKDLQINNAVSGKDIPVELAKTEINLPEFSLQGSSLSLPNLTVNYDVVGGKGFPLQTVKGQLSLNTLTGDINKQTFNLAALNLDTNATGDSIPGGRADIKLSTSAEIDLQNQTAKLPEFEIRAMNLAANGSVSATQIKGDAIADANLKIAQTDLRALLKKLEIALPEMSNQKSLTKFASDISLNFDKKSQRLAINQLKVQLDESKLTGKASVANFSTPQVRYDLALDQINLNHYLPPKKAAAPEAENKPTPEQDIQLPTEMLRKLDVKGTVKVGGLQFDNLQPKNILMTLQAAKGNIQVAPLRADIFKTRINSEAGLDVRGKTPKYRAKVLANNVPIGDVLKAVADTDKLSGTGSINANITTAGNNVTSFKKALNGSLSANLKNGAVKGFNLAQAIRDAKAKIAGKKVEKTNEPQQTDFSSLIGSFTVKNGLVNTEKLTAQAPFMRINGSGTVNLPKESLNYLVKAKIVGSDKGQGGKELKDLNGLTIPVKLKGSMTSPDVSLDLGSVLEQKTKAQIEEKKKQVVEETKKKLEDKLKDSLFKGLKF